MQISRRSYRACSYAEHILITNLCLTMFIRDSRRSYRSYPYSELILITDLCLSGTPVGVTDLIPVRRYP